MADIQMNAFLKEYSRLWKRREANSNKLPAEQRRLVQFASRAVREDMASFLEEPLED